MECRRKAARTWGGTVIDKLYIVIGWDVCDCIRCLYFKVIFRFILIWTCLHCVLFLNQSGVFVTHWPTALLQERILQQYEWWNFSVTISARVRFIQCAGCKYDNFDIRNVRSGRYPRHKLMCNFVPVQLKFADGTEYAGEFQNGMNSGYGVLTFSDGVSLTQSFCCCCVWKQDPKHLWPRESQCSVMMCEVAMRTTQNCTGFDSKTTFCLLF